MQMIYHRRALPMIAAFLLIAGCTKATVRSPAMPTSSVASSWQEAKEAVKRADAASNKRDKADLAQVAIAKADHCLLTNPEEANCYYYRAIGRGLYYEAHIIGYQEGLRQMVDDLTKVIALSPTTDHAGAYRVLAQIYSQSPEWGGANDVTRDISKAEEYALRAIELAPDYPANYLELSTVMLSQKEGEKAEESLMRADEQLPYWRAENDYSLWVKRSKTLHEQLKRIQ